MNQFSLRGYTYLTQLRALVMFFTPSFNDIAFQRESLKTQYNTNFLHTEI